jgi:hypothetical protein
MKGTWQTTDSGGGGGAGAPLAALGLFLAAAVVVKYVLVPAAHMALDVLRVVFIALGVALGAVFIAGVVWVAVRLHRGSPVAPRRRPVLTAEVLTPQAAAARTLPAVTAPSDRVAIGPVDRPEVHTHIHVHLSGDPAADAATVRALTERNG